MANKSALVLTAGQIGEMVSTDTILGNLSGNAATVTTNANLTGIITSSGNATSFGSFTSAQILAGCSDETGTGALVFGTNPTLDAPVINNLPTGTGVSSSSVASTLVSRGSTQNSFANAFVNKATNLASAAGTTILTTSSARIYTLTGVTTQTIQLPDATNLTTGATYIFNNDSTGLLTITNDGGSTVCTIAAGGAALITCTSISTANGAYTVRFFMPSNVVSGTAGLIVTGTLGAVSFSGAGTGLTGTASSLTAGIANAIVLTPAPPDVTVSGQTMSLTAGENVVFGDVVYIKSDGKMWKADANAAGLFPANYMATATILADAAGVFLRSGFARNDAWSWTVGGKIYLSTAAGGMTQTAPSATDNCVQILGTATHADRMDFTPSPDYITIL